MIGEGGSGGALALGVANRILMLEYATYSVISPEGCASILWRDDSKKPEAAAAMKMTATDLLRLGVVDEVVPRGAGRRPPRPRRQRATWATRCGATWPSCCCMPPETLRDDRYRKFRHMGAFVESGDKEACARTDAALVAEALRVNARYVEELVIGWNLCPWAAKAWRDGAVARRVFLDAEPAGAVSDVAAFIAEADGSPGFEVGLAIFPRAAVSLGAWEAFAEQVRRAAGPFVVAAFHPDYRRDDEPADNAAQLVSALRRTPDPTLQFLRADAARRRPRRFSAAVARANFETVASRGPAALAALLSDLRRDRDATRSR